MYIDYRNNQRLDRSVAALALMAEDDQLDPASAVAILEDIEKGREAVAIGQWDDSYFILWMPETGDEIYDADTDTWIWAINANIGDETPGYPLKRIK